MKKIPFVFINFDFDYDLKGVYLTTPMPERPSSSHFIWISSDIFSLDEQNDTKIGDFSSNAHSNILICNSKPYIISCAMVTTNWRVIFLLFERS